MAQTDVIVCKVADLAEGEMKEVEIEDGKALLIRDSSGFHAIGNKCSHYGAPLVKGALGNGHVRCPWHGACFNYKTGDIEDYPGLDSVPKHKVIVDGDDVKICVKKSDKGVTKRQKPMVLGGTNDKESIVIVGGGPASVTCAETLRQEGFKGKITIVSKEHHIAYDRPKLSKALSIKPEDIELRKPDFYEKYNIEYMKNSEVTSIDLNGNSVNLEDGSKLKYKKLLLATGASPRKCTFIKNHDLENIHTLRTVDDANAIATKGKDKNVIIIGTSFIGVEVAAALVGKASSVTIIDLVDAPFQMALGKEVGGMVRQLLEEKGIKCYFNNSVSEFLGEDGVLTQAVLKDGTVLDADLCVVGIGVLPVTEFLKDSGLEITDRGFVKVDKRMKTSHDNVFAAGDITHFPLFMAHNEHVNIQHWQMAHQQGKIAALSMMGNPNEIRSVPFFWTVIFGKSLRYCGYGFGYDDIVIHGELSELKFVAYYTKNDNVVAVASLNYDPIVSQSAEMFLCGQPFTKKLVKSSNSDPQWLTAQLENVRKLQGMNNNNNYSNKSQGKTVYSMVKDNTANTACCHIL